MYREQEYVDRCHCDAPATERCAMCNRARCATHLEQNERCHRCNEAVGYEMGGRETARWGWAIAVGAGGGLASLIAHAMLLVLPLAAGGAAATYIALRVSQRRRAER
jgi:hypothetical protein